MSSSPQESTVQGSSDFRISTLVFLRNPNEELLMLKRSKAPNAGKWSPIGGKLETSQGESPFECAIRETYEETGFEIQEPDLHLFACVSEKNYENAGHWLMFLFACHKPLPFLPQKGDEGDFAFFRRSNIESMDIPRSDKTLIWPLFDEYKDGGFVVVRANCSKPDKLQIKIEESNGGHN